MEECSNRNSNYKLLTGTIIVMYSEKEAFVVKNTGSIKKSLQKLSEVALPDGNQLCQDSKCFIFLKR